MPLTIENASEDSDGLCRLAIDQDLTIYVIDELKQQISPQLKNFNKFELDLSAVEEIDSAGVQLLLALDVELKRTHKLLHLTAMSGCVTALIESYGLVDRLPNQRAG